MIGDDDSPLRSRHATINDLAAAAGVSNATVSRVMNGSPRVSPETRDRVLALADRMNYVANGPARALRSNTSTQVAVIVPDIANDHFHLVAKALARRFASIGLLTAIHDSGFDPEIENRLVTEVLKTRPAAIVLASTAPDATSRPDHLGPLERSRVPVALFDRPLGTDRFPLVEPDHDEGARICARLATEAGSGPIHILAGPAEIYALRLRLRAAADELNRADRPHVPHIGPLDADATGGVVAEVGTNAIFLALNSTLALGAARELVRAGATLKDRLVSFDEVPGAVDFGHPFPGVRCPPTRVADEVFAALLPALRDGAETTGGRRVAPVEIVRADLSGALKPCDRPRATRAGSCGA